MVVLAVPLVPASLMSRQKTSKKMVEKAVGERVGHRGGWRNRKGRPGDHGDGEIAGMPPDVRGPDFRGMGVCLHHSGDGLRFCGCSAAWAPSGLFDPRNTQERVAKGIPHGFRAPCERRSNYQPGLAGSHTGPCLAGPDPGDCRGHICHLPGLSSMEVLASASLPSRWRE